MMRGRFAPSPTGYMHLGNVWTAFLAWLLVRQMGGRLVLRIEDIDEARSHAEYKRAICRDLRWLGLTWDEGPEVGGAYAPYTQQERYAHYQDAVERLAGKGLLYPCFCTRARLMGVGAPHAGETAVYDGHCYRMHEKERAAASAVRTPSWRVHVPAEKIAFADMVCGTQEVDLARAVGDFRVCRADELYAYPLAVSVDDMEMGITHVVRGRDLLAQTPAQIWLIQTLGGTPPAYAHIPMLVDADGNRLSKRQKGLTVRELRAAGKKPEAILSALAVAGGLIPERGGRSLEELVRSCDWYGLRPTDISISSILSHL